MWIARVECEECDVSALLAELSQQSRSEVSQRPVIVDVRTQAQLTTDDTRRDRRHELVQLKHASNTHTRLLQ